MKTWHSHKARLDPSAASKYMFFILALLASLVHAQVGEYSALAVLQPRLGEVINAGESFELKWKPSPAIPAVDLVVKGGGQGNLETVAVIARNVPNSGTYLWDVPRSMKTSTALSLMVHDSRDASIANFSPYFTVLEVGRGFTKVASSIAEHTKNRPTETIFVNIKEHHAAHTTRSSFVDSTSTLANLTSLRLSSTASSGASHVSASEMQAATSARLSDHDMSNKAIAKSNGASAAYPPFLTLVALLFL